MGLKRFGCRDLVHGDFMILEVLGRTSVIVNFSVRVIFFFFLFLLVFEDAIFDSSSMALEEEDISAIELLFIKVEFLLPSIRGITDGNCFLVLKLILEDITKFVFR